MAVCLECQILIHTNAKELESLRKLVDALDVFVAFPQSHINKNNVLRRFEEYRKAFPKEKS